MAEVEMRLKLWRWGRSGLRGMTEFGNLVVSNDGLEVSVEDDHYSGVIPPAEAQDLALAILDRFPKKETATPALELAERGLEALAALTGANVKSTEPVGIQLGIELERIVKEYGPLDRMSYEALLQELGELVRRVEGKPLRASTCACCQAILQMVPSRAKFVQEGRRDMYTPSVQVLHAQPYCESWKSNDLHQCIPPWESFT